MRTPGRINCNLTFAERTYLCRRRCRCFFLLKLFSHPVHRLHDDKHDQSHNQEIKDCRNKFPVIQCCFPQKLYMKLVKIHSPKYSEDRIDDILHKLRHNTGKRSAYDNADCHVHDIATADEFFKFTHKFFHSQTPPVSFVFPIIAQSISSCIACSQFLPIYF